jgi:hypothetical protein
MLVKDVRCFNAWLKKTEITDDAVGDFIADARRDEGLPRRLVSIARLKRYLRARDACDETVEAAEAAWGRYMADVAKVVEAARAAWRGCEGGP